MLESKSSTCEILFLLWLVAAQMVKCVYLRDNLDPAVVKRIVRKFDMRVLPCLVVRRSATRTS